tara:strand:+ start:1145 stop:1507 length:363 start_codon:yes stop_codon:yes gene_type:complete
MVWLKDLLTGGLFSSIENISKELVDTPLEKAQAQVLKIKAIDPSGKLRRDVTSTTMHLYKIYIYVMLFLLLLSSFDLENAARITGAIESMKELFLPITTAFGAIMTASFGVNTMNAHKGA